MLKSAPCVLWIDELEKAFAGTSTDDGGEITIRLLGLFLTWMQEKTSPVFVVATANNVERLPIELLRKGRFDEIFYVGTPNASERRDIFKIHMDKVRYNDNFEWSDSESDTEKKLDKLVSSTLGYSGADIAEIVAEAVEISFSKFMAEKRYQTIKNFGEEKKKPVFNPNTIQDVIDKSAQISAWNQLRRIFGNYKRKKFKNASRTDFYDIFYWINLRLKYFSKSPKRTLHFIKAIIQTLQEILHERGVAKTEQWDEEENKIKTQSLPKLPLKKRICRRVARKFFKLIEVKK